VRRRQSSRLCAPVAPTALFLSTTTETTSSSWRGRHRGSRRRSGQPHTPRGTVAEALTGADAPATLRAGGGRGGRVPDDGGSPDRRGRADSWVDGYRGLYRRRGSPSSDRYYGHHGIHGGWPTLTKTNYVEWAAVMRVRLQMWHMWEAV
jgi:hypothetical protein